jgi:hypothetical protein
MDLWLLSGIFMATPLSNYIAIKDKYCIGYFGSDRSLLSDMLNSRKFIEKEFPGLQIYIACKNEMQDLVMGNKNVILESNMSSFTGKLAYFRILEEKSDLNKLLEESNISVGV